MKEKIAVDDKRTAVIGTLLCDEDRRHVLSAFVHRFTRDHVPKWALRPRPDGTPYKVQFASDLEWLANTYFVITRGGRIDMRHSYCESHQTWPDNPELRTTGYIGAYQTK